MAEELRNLRVFAKRGGTIDEITTYLKDMEDAYESLYVFNQKLELLNPNSEKYRRFGPWIYEFGFPYLFDTTRSIQENRKLVLPEDRLIIEKVSIQSPGFWEFLGSLNPLLQIREYLNDRHRRRQDREWREETEKQKAILENQIIQQKLIEGNNPIIKDRIEILKELGYTQEEIRQLIWTNVSTPLMQLGKHQDNGLIENAE
ncbi:MAG: hypothetical protein SF053_05240 [Bacteroidia bacterium]|nr:hypothetical protein [Bacteroidia bacterium]